MIGQLILSPRAPGELFTPADRRLLRGIPRQVAVAAHAVRLTADLQRARERLVTAREEERRRLRHDLHDGLGPTRTGFTFGLDGAYSLLTKSSKDADALLAELKSQAQVVMGEIRRLIYNLRPPALNDFGLVVAVREQATNHGFVSSDDLSEEMGGAGRTNGLVFFIEASEHLPPLLAAVEVAAYRIAQEAMTNVARYARASACRVRLSLDDTILRVSWNWRSPTTAWRCRKTVMPAWA
jgi:signal transduction histidine kinase